MLAFAWLFLKLDYLSHDQKRIRPQTPASWGLTPPQASWMQPESSTGNDRWPHNHVSDVCDHLRQEAKVHVRHGRASGPLRRENAHPRLACYPETKSFLEHVNTNIDMIKRQQIGTAVSWATPTCAKRAAVSVSWLLSGQARGRSGVSVSHPPRSSWALEMQLEPEAGLEDAPPPGGGLYNVEAQNQPDFWKGRSGRKGSEDSRLEATVDQTCLGW